LRAIIPAAGYASRLRPLTDQCHKAMLPLGNTTMMALILENLRRVGVMHAVIVTGYRADSLMDHVRSIGRGFRLDFVHNPEFSVTNNAYSLSLAESHAAGREFLLLDCDVVFEPDVLVRLMHSANDNVIAVQKRTDLGNEEMKVYSENGETVSRLTKNGDPRTASGESIGIERFSAGFSARLFDALHRRIRDGNGRAEYYEDAFQELIDGGDRLHMVDVSDCKVVEVDFKSDLEKAEKEILPHLRGIQSPADSACR
jgi:choline kinase